MTKGQTQKSVSRVGSNADLTNATPEQPERDKKELLELDAMQRYFTVYDSSSKVNEPTLMPPLWAPKPVQETPKSNNAKGILTRRATQENKPVAVAVDRVALASKKSFHSPSLLSPLRKTLDVNPQSDITNLNLKKDTNHEVAEEDSYTFKKLAIE